MPRRRKPKTEFGVKLLAFAGETGLTYKDIAELAKVKRNTMIDCTTGKCAGYELIPRVEQFMLDYRRDIAIRNRDEAIAIAKRYESGQ